MSLVPGFRFHPTDEELLRYYLRRKICGKPLHFDGIAEIDIYKAEPWDLPDKSKLKTRDMEWYFFSVLYKKCGKGCRTNRATDKGYWKTTGNDRSVKRRCLVIGMKKTLVYHYGRAPHGERTDWVMHEYRLIDELLEKAGFVQDAYVLCRVFKKSGSGPKNGEKYGAPLVEQEWEDEELEFVQKEDDCNVVKVTDDDFLAGNFVKQIEGAEISPLLLSSCSCIDDSIKLGYNNKDDLYENQRSDIQVQTNITGSEASGYYEKNQTEDNQYFGLPVEESDPTKHQYVHEPSLTSLLGEQYLDAARNNLPFDDKALIVEAINEDDSLAYFDSNDYMSEYLSFDPLSMEEFHDLLSFLPDNEKEIDPVMSNEEIDGFNNVNPSSSKQTTTITVTGIQNPCVNINTSRMLGNIPAPPALAMDIPTNQVARPSNYIPLSSTYGPYNLTVAFGFSREDNSTALESAVRIVPGKPTSSGFNGWFWFFVFSVLILSLIFKVRTFIYDS